jgi:hypothetical protein
MESYHEGSGKWRPLGEGLRALLNRRDEVDAGELGATKGPAIVRTRYRAWPAALPPPSAGVSITGMSVQPGVAAATFGSIYAEAACTHA